MKMIAFIGPSGSGKSTLIRELHRHGAVQAFPSWTTRPRRPDETGDDSDHRFVTTKDFEKLQTEDFFLEVIELYGFRYGLPDITSTPNSKVPAISVRAPLLKLVSVHFPNHVVYQIESSLETASKRIEARRLTSREKEERLKSYPGELELGRQLCHRSFDTSGLLSKVVEDVERAIAEDFQMPKVGGYSTDTNLDGRRSQ
jgi:guanylate kinase